MRWEAGGHTATGPVRAHNDDTFLLDLLPEGIFVAVADGAGGKAVLYPACLQAMGAHLAPLTPQERLSRAALDGAIEAARATLPGMRGEEDWGEGYTISGVMAWGAQIRVFWLGDVHIWRLRGGHLERLGNDHLLVTHMVALGRLSEAEARTSSLRNILLRCLVTRTDATALGDWQADCTDVLEARVGDRYLLLSDGVWQPLLPLDLLEVARQGAAVDVARRLVAEAYRRDSKDNATALVLDAVG